MTTLQNYKYSIDFKFKYKDYLNNQKYIKFLRNLIILEKFLFIQNFHILHKKTIYQYI